eukprot:m.259890 g.259890  ORF g.259890 m.259890 type:complete len:359 (+) comp40428_c0_seq33:60-1136(+)
MCKRACIGFSLLMAVLLIGFQLLWGLSWIQYRYRLSGSTVKRQSLRSSEFPNLPPPCEENKEYVASPAFCEQESTPFSFILVMSAAVNFNRRHGQRSLFLRSRFHMSPEFMKQYAWKYVFLVGKPNSKSKRVNEDVQRKLDEEGRCYQDILQVDVLENYYNLTMKKMAAFDYLIQSNITFEILLKTDDDCFVNIQLVMEWLIAEVPPAYNRTWNKLKTEGKSVLNSTKYFFGGHCRGDRKPIRAPKSKWYLSKADYKHEYFPPFCYGYGYFLSYDVIKVITTSPASAQMRWFRLEDIHTGLLVNKSGILSDEDVKSTNRITDGGRCVRGGGYPLIVMAGRYKYMRLMYDDFLKGRRCR